MKVFFRNSKWKKTYACFSNSSTNQKIVVRMKKNNDNEFETEVENKKYNRVYFKNHKYIRSIRTNTFSFIEHDLFCQYAFNKKISANLSYLFSNNKKTGQVKSIYLKDSKNLHYRKNSKKIDIWIPNNFNYDIPCGILIYFDSQNIFSKVNKYTSNYDSYGGVQLDVIYDNLKIKNKIIVGIDNSDKYRDKELTMSQNIFGKLDFSFDDGELRTFRNGKLDNLLDFIKETVIPYLDKNFIVDYKNIGIGGSSSGGLASFYGGFRDNDIYSYIITLSPAFGLFKQEDYIKFLKKQFKSNTKIYFYCGNGDSLEKTLFPMTQEVYNLCVSFNNGDNTNYIFNINNDGHHNEEYWRLVLTEGIEFTDLK